MAALPKLARIKERPDYLAVAKTGRKWVTPAFILQTKPAKASETGKAGGGDKPPRVGFTASKKVGNAVVRSKVRRRLKEAARRSFPETAAQGWDYVLIGRQAAFDYNFEKLVADMRWALAKLSSSADLKPTVRNNRHKK
ncbi:hypothetical protein GCM10017044_02940 [Kordiimonas sediminis]|uniref:Ribonuclease P protein component n=1 Tax=Kordiimonas sediminis TaxID=1735581 RepID=A0A919AK62_9PROT|nr:ribonuclease P protein component [Kordiimonas sediminis]GHF12403.1 hypothetical protein GCM10017044_02940 [Kordiimonas sediminis]